MRELDSMIQEMDSLMQDKGRLEGELSSIQQERDAALEAAHANTEQVVAARSETERALMVVQTTQEREAQVHHQLSAAEDKAAALQVILS